MKSFSLATSTALATLLACSSVHAGVIVETVARDKTTGKEESTQRMQIQGGMARMESGSRGTITLFKNETLFVLDTTRKSFMAIDAATMQRTMGAMNDAMQKMQAQMASMPAEQRAMMEKMMKQNGMPGATAPSKPPVLDATPVGTIENVAGRSCKVWNITRDGAPSNQVCVVSYSGLPGKDEVQALAKKMSVLLEKLPESLRSQYNGNPFQQVDNVSAKLNGVPFITRSFRDGVLESKETVVKSWQEQAVTASQFEIPAGYTKQELPIPQQKP